MKLRPYLPDRDFPVIQGWIADEREHALWCANRIGYPLDREDFDRAMRWEADRFGGSPYVAATEEGEPVGFFCYSLDPETNVGLLKFVVVDPARRGQGFGRELMRLAIQLAFDVTGADAVRLSVFPENIRAKRCYESVGFTEQKTEPIAFRFGKESWGRCTMLLQRPKTPPTT